MEPGADEMNEHVYSNRGDRRDGPREYYYGLGLIVRYCCDIAAAIALIGCRGCTVYYMYTFIYKYVVQLHL